MKKAYILLILMFSLLLTSTAYAEATIQTTFDASDCITTICGGGLDPSAPVTFKIYETDSDYILFLEQAMTDEDGNYSYKVNAGMGNFTAEITCADVSLSCSFFSVDHATQYELLNRINNFSGNDLIYTIEENADCLNLLGLNIDAYLALPDNSRRAIAYELSGNRFYSMFEVSEKFNELILLEEIKQNFLEQINNIYSVHELKEIVLENSDVIGLDLSLYHKIKDQYKVFQMLVGRKCNSLVEFRNYFYEACNDAYNSSNTGSGGGGTSSGSRRDYISSACFEKGGISLDLTAKDDFTETDTIFIAVYKADINKLTAVAEVPFLDYPADEDGYREFSMQIPYKEPENVRIKILGFSSMENLVPLFGCENFLSAQPVEAQALSISPNAVISSDMYGMDYLNESNSSAVTRINFASNFELYQNGRLIGEFAPELFFQNGLRSILLTDGNGDGKYEKIELGVTDLFIIDSINISDNIYTVLPDTSENSFGTYLEPISFTDGNYTLSDTTGADVALSDLKKYDVLAIHDNGEFLDITLIRNSVHGTVTKITKDSLYIDNAPFSFTKEIDIFPGNSIIAFLDDLGNICKVSKQCSAKPVVITSFSDGEIGFLELLTQDEKITVSNIEEIMIDGLILTWKEAVNQEFIPKNTLCLYETDPQSGLPSLYISEQNEFRYTNYRGIGMYNLLSSTLGEFKLTKDTVLFAGDGESPENASNFICIDTNFLNDGYNYGFDAIINEYNEIISLILYTDANDDINYNTYPMIITDTARVYKDGKVDVELNGYINGVSKTLTISLKKYNEIDPDNIGLEGSVIFYKQNIFTNELTFDFLAKMQNGELNCKDNGLSGDMVSETNGSSLGEYVTYSIPNRCQTDGSGYLPGFAAVSHVEKIENNTLYFADSDKTLRIYPNTLAYMISLRDGKISKTTVTDLETARYSDCDDYVYVYAYNGYVKLIYIIDVDGDNNDFKELYYTVTFTALGADASKNVIYTAPNEYNIPYKIDLNPNFVSYNITDSDGQSMTLSDICAGDVITIRPMQQINSDKWYYRITVSKN